MHPRSHRIFGVLPPRCYKVYAAFLIIGDFFEYIWSSRWGPYQTGLSDSVSVSDEYENPNKWTISLKLCAGAAHEKIVHG